MTEALILCLCCLIFVFFSCFPFVESFNRRKSLLLTSRSRFSLVNILFNLGTRSPVAESLTGVPVLIWLLCELEIVSGLVPCKMERSSRSYLKEPSRGLIMLEGLPQNAGLLKDFHNFPTLPSVFIIGYLRRSFAFYAIFKQRFAHYSRA